MGVIKKKDLGYAIRLFLDVVVATADLGLVLKDQGLLALQLLLDVFYRHLQTQGAGYLLYWRIFTVLADIYCTDGY